MKILLVEDDERIAEALAEDLTDQNYLVDTAPDGEMAWDLIEAFSYNLILLDVMLPKLDGIQLCQKIRQAGYHFPVLLLTAKDTREDKIIGLDSGADDYVVKPFDLKVLSARIRALLRRGNITLPPVLQWGTLELNPNTCEAIYADNPLNLTPKEFSILQLFLRNGCRVLSRTTILEELWSNDSPPEEETIKAHIKGLRQKLKSVGAPTDFIETIYGVGYRLNQQYEASMEALP